MFLAKATMAGGKLVEIRTDVVKLVEQVRALMSPAGEQVTLGQALIEIYRAQSGESSRTEAIRQVVAALDLPVDELWARLDRLKKYLVKMEEQVEPFILPLSTAGELLNLPLSFSAKPQSMSVGDIAFSLGGDLATALTVSSFNSAEPPKEWSGAIAADSAIQSLSLSGSIGFKGSASGAFGQGSLNFSSTMTGNGRINLYHQYAAATPRVDALVGSSRAWAVPWDLADLAEKLKPVTADGSATGFRRIQVLGDGTVDLAGGVTVGRALSYDAKINTPVGPKTLGAKGKVGASLDFSLKRTGSFSYLIEKDAQDKVTVNLVRNASHTADRSINLSADIEVTGLNEVAKAYLDRFFEDPAGLLTKLDDWTRPGDKLIAELKATDWKTPGVEEIGSLLLGDSTKKELTDAAIGKLKEKLQQQLNEKIPFWGESGDDVADQLIAAITDRLDLDADLSNKLAGKLRPTLVKRIGGVHQKFDDAVQKLVPGATADLDKFLTPFESVAEDIDALRVRVNKNAKAIIDPVIKLLQRYQDIRSKLYAGLHKVAQFKIGMTFAASLQRDAGNDSLLSYRVVEVNDVTMRVHRAFLLGRMSQAWPDFKTAMAKGFIDNVSGHFGVFSRRESTVGFSMHFGDIGISMTRVKSSDVDVQVSPSGSVLVASEKISQENIVKAFNIERRVGFTGTYDLAVAARDPNAFPTPLGFNLAYQDSKLKTKDLEEFLGSLERPAGGRSLLPTGAARRAVTAFQEMIAKNHGGSADARIDVTLPVGVRDLARLININNEKIENRAIDLLIELRITDPRRQRFLDALVENFENGATERDIALFVAGKRTDRAIRLLQRKTGLDFGSTSRTSPLDGLVRQLRTIAGDAQELVNAVDGIRGIAQLQREIAVLPVDPPMDQAEQIVRRLEALNRQINDGLDDWIKARKPIAGLFTESVPAVTVALLGLIAQLSGDATSLIPIVDVAGEQGGQILVA